MNTTYINDWKRKNTTRVVVQLNNEADKDLVAFLRDRNKADTIKRALRLLIEEEGV